MEAAAQGSPPVLLGFVEAVKLMANLGIDGAKHGLEQSGLVGEVVMQRPAGDARLGRQRIERDLCEAPFGEGAAGGGDEPRRRLFGSPGAGGKSAIDIRTVCDYRIDIRMVCQMRRNGKCPEG